MRVHAIENKIKNREKSNTLICLALTTYFRSIDKGENINNCKCCQNFHYV